MPGVARGLLVCCPFGSAPPQPAATADPSKSATIERIIVPFRAANRGKQRDVFACAAHARSGPSNRHRVRAFFALFAVFAILGIFVFDGAVAGATSLVAMIVFIAACAYALRKRPDRPRAKSPDRAGRVVR